MQPAETQVNEQILRELGHLVKESDQDEISWDDEAMMFMFIRCTSKYGMWVCVEGVVLELAHAKSPKGDTEFLKK